MVREIESIHDITVEDVQTAHDFNELVGRLQKYADGREAYKDSFFEEQILEDLDAISESVYQQLAVVYAQAQDQSVDPAKIVKE